MERKAELGPRLAGEARALMRSIIKAGIVHFNFSEGYTMSSGLISPVYVDGRALTAHPEVWKRVVEKVAKQSRTYDAVAGVATGGISHSAAVAYRAGKPHAFVRKEAKEHGTVQQVEGASVRGKSVLLIEDTVTTGGSMIRAASALRDAGAKTVSCVSLFGYGFSESAQVFLDAKLPYRALFSVRDLVEEARRTRLISEEEYQKVLQWFREVHEGTTSGTLVY